MNDSLQDYLDHIEGLNYSPKSTRTYKYACLRFIRYFQNHGRTELFQLKETDLRNWQKHLSKKLNKRGAPIKAGSVNSEISRVRSFLLYAVGKGSLMKSVVDALDLVKEPRMLPLGVFSAEEFERMTEGIDTTSPLGFRDRTIIELLYSSAIRANELITMDLRSVDFKNGTALIMGKGSKERVVPIGKTALKYLENYIKAIRPFLLDGRDSQALFISLRRRRIRYDCLLKIIHKHAEKTDIEENVTPHTFRRSATTEMIRNNANLYHVKEILGHESLNTLKHYTKLTITDLKRTHRRCHPREKMG